ncbi:DNA/RNA non-specific endonuclease [Streptomyces sp. NPDC004327]|uniref:DNA/RNA non-specific endonuclease n=1 Tax=Streptomyces sp. NPDC004327 TaxID=3364699 RepID=UPI0036B029CD
MRRIFSSLLLVLSLTATATGTAAAGNGETIQPDSSTYLARNSAGKAPLSQPTDFSLRKTGRIVLSDRPPLPAPAKTRPVKASSKENCEPTPARSRVRKAGAVQACVTTSTASPLSGPRSFAVQPSAADSGSCTITDPGKWWHGRFGYCVYGLTVLYTLKDSNGKVIGTGTLNVSSSAVLSATDTKWNELVTVTMTEATGAVTTLNVKFRAMCTAGCTVTKPAPWVGATGTLIKGKVASGNVSYASSPAAGTKVDFTTSYEMYVTAPGAQITDPTASWSNPEKIRCDDDVRDTTNPTSTPAAGCVVPGVIAVVRMSDSPSAPGAGAAAAGYLWAQNKLADGWGRAKPLTRAKNDVDARAARTCGSFQARTDIIPTDTCDTFPFAATHEGGADGALCAEIIPNYSTGGWDVYELKGDANAPCMRAHVPVADKQAAASQLSEGYATQRVLEAEQFRVDITGSTAEPQAACLNNVPAGALPSGNGWIRNSTNPVLQVNKTTTPPGPPGTRAAMAQACLGVVTGDGSAAAGDITGWQDAQEFARINSPGTQLARCHLIANILGGKGGTADGGPDNLVPCWQSGMNTGTPSMRTYEAVTQKAVKEPKDGGILGPNDAIFYQVTPDYRDSTSTIPQGVTMTARVERADGSSQPLFPDIYITNTKGNTGLLDLGN